MNLEEFKLLTRQDFAEWYDARMDLFIKIEKLINEDLTGFSKTTGSNRLVFYEARIKTFDSLWEKIQKFKEGGARDVRKQIEERQLNPDNFNLMDIINDIVGARLVFYFEPDLPFGLIYFLTYPIYITKEVKVYDFQNTKLKFPFNITDRIVKVAKLFKTSSKPKTKPSGYESLHVILNYNQLLLKQKLLTSGLKDVITPRDYESVSSIPVEIQLRTLLQHGWAQVEHTLNYSKKKSLSAGAVLKEYQENDFITNKVLSRSVENHQNQIWAKYWKRDDEGNEISKETVVYTDRFRFFSRPDQKTLKTYYQEFNSDISAVSTDQFIAFSETIKSLDKRSHFLNDEVPSSHRTWGKRRSILLFVGYIGLHCTKKDVGKLIIQLLDDFSMKMSDEIKLNLIALYEYVRKVDTLFRDEQIDQDERYSFIDPLVSYRAAGIHYVTGNSRRAIGLMSDALKEREVLLEGYSEQLQTSSIINTMHIKRRISEYYWRAYNQDIRTEYSDLEKAINLMEKAFIDLDTPPGEKLRTERRKILSKIIIYKLYSVLHISNKFNMTEFNKTIDLYENDILDLFVEEELKSRSNGSLGLEALAIYCWAKKEKKKARELINLAMDRLRLHSKVPYILEEVKELYRIIVNLP